LEALRRYAVLDTLPEEALDDLTKLAAHLCATPIATITLIDDRRQWFKSKVGVEITETPREWSFCAHALGRRELLIVPDATQDARFVRNPMVTGEPGIRFYAGAPLVTPEGAALGALCVIDHVPRELTAVQKQALVVLSRQVMVQLELRRQTAGLIASEERYRALIEHAPDGILIADSGSTYLDANASMCRMLGYAREELIGLQARDIVMPEEIPHIEVALGVIKAHADYHREWRFRRKDNSTFPAEVIATQMPDGTLLAMVRDITARRQAEAVAQSEKLFSDTMIESMPGILYFYDDQGRFLRWNRNFETVSGYTGEEIARMRPPDFFARTDQPPVRERIAEVFASGESSIEVPFLAKDGRTTPYFFTGRRVMFEGKTCLVGMGIDISERKLAEDLLTESERKYRELVERANSIILRWNSEGRITFLNEFGQRFFGYSAEEITGRHVMGTIVPATESSGRDLERLMEEICANPEAFEQNVNENMRRDGQSVWISWTNCVERDEQGRVHEILSIGTDITERLKAEQAVRELNASLEQRVAERTAELQAALVRAEAADRLKSAFLATMSHELRTPLNSIIGFTGAVLLGIPGPLNPEQAKQLGMVRSSARHLLELINDVLDLSKIEAGQLKVRTESFDLRTSLERVTASVKVLADKKGLTLTAVVAPEIGELVSDRRRVEQIVLNLLNNAIKFTDRGGVTLTAGRVADFRPSPEAPPQPAVRIAVADTGIGIKPEHLAALFQPFQQVDTGLARQHEGTGLGLVICRRLVTLLGGQIAFASEWEKGTEFTVLLPLQKPPDL